MHIEVRYSYNIDLKSIEVVIYVYEIIRFINVVMRKELLITEVRSDRNFDRAILALMSACYNIMSFRCEHS